MSDLNRSTMLNRRTIGRPLANNSATRTMASADVRQAIAQPVTTGEHPVLRSESLLQNRSHVSIVHNGETYQLRATRLGKLILTK